MTSGKQPSERDERVSDVYRELEPVKAPEDLNRRVLDMAARESGSRRRSARLLAPWMKPAAWTAVVGLSLAIVLELNQVADAPLTPAGLPVAVPLPAADDSAALQGGADGFADTETNAEAEPARQADERQKLEVFSRESKGDADVKAAPAQRSLPMLGATPEQDESEKRLLDSPANTAARVDAVEASERKELIAEYHCNPEQRATRETWLKCIQSLRDAGDAAAARSEFDAYTQIFGSKLQGPATE